MLKIFLIYNIVEPPPPSGGIGVFLPFMAIAKQLPFRAIVRDQACPAQHASKKFSFPFCGGAPSLLKNSPLVCGQTIW